ncbi:MAG: hypothetical protein ABIP31_01055 [Chitinophagaceae bacterium]
MWLGIAAIMITLGNAHTFLFNCIYFLISIVCKKDLVSTNNLLTGIRLGIAFNYIGVLNMIEWLSDKNTYYVFDQSNLLPNDRKNS